MSDNRSLRTIVAQLAGLPPLQLGDQTIGTGELSLILAINPELPYAEAMRTPQLISELGALTAHALAAKEDAELAYRIWRDTLVHRLTNSIEAAKDAGFECAVNPGTDAKDKPKDPKTPSASAVEVYLRTLPEYKQHYDAQNAATRTWAALHAAYKGAEARQWAIRMKEDSGGNQVGPVADLHEVGPAWDPTSGMAPQFGTAPPVVAPPPAAVPPPPVAPPPPTIPGAPPPPVLAPFPPTVFGGAPVLPPPPVGPPPPVPTMGDNHAPPPGFPPSGETPPAPGMEQGQKRKRPPPPIPH